MSRESADGAALGLAEHMRDQALRDLGNRTSGRTGKMNVLDAQFASDTNTYHEVTEAAANSLSADNGDWGSLSPGQEDDSPLFDIGGESTAAQSAMPFDVAPTDPQINEAWQESANDPDEDRMSSLGKMLQSEGSIIKDRLDTLVSAGTTFASHLMDDPVAQWAAFNQGSASTVPLPRAGDTPEEATDKVFAQAVVGIRDLVKEYPKAPLGFARALYEYGEKMVNQMGADLSLAFDTEDNR